MSTCYYLFDLLLADGSDLRGEPFALRRQALQAESESWGGDTLRLVLHSGDGPALWNVVTTHGLEGVVAKRPGARYSSHRSSDWLKVKSVHTVSCLVGGFDPGQGSRAATFGALHLYLLRGEALVPVGRVGSGFSDAELAHITTRMQTPPLIVEVQYLDVTPDGQLRQPVFLRVRDDQTMTDCTIEQVRK